MELQVRLRLAPDREEPVGRLLRLDRRTSFEFDADFLERGLDLSPFRFPRRPGLLTHDDHGFGPLPGVFDDSLPDEWGRLLMDRALRRRRPDDTAIDPLERLAWLGSRTMGALTYHPPSDVDGVDQARLLDLHGLAMEAGRIIDGDVEDVLPELLRAGGSPGGARPKVVVGVAGDRIVDGGGDLSDAFLADGGAHWLIKFGARGDDQYAGSIEYAYARMAGAAGVDMPDVRLFSTRVGRRTHRWFGVRRFDRPGGNRRRHAHTFANLLHADFRLPSLDYADLLKATRLLTRDTQAVERAFRIAVFNVLAHNRDDHAKNFGFLLDAETGEWTLAPAYDLTLSDGPGGEHSLSVGGEGRRPERPHLESLAAAAGLGPRVAGDAIDRTLTALAEWPGIADEAGCPATVVRQVARRHRAI